MANLISHTSLLAFMSAPLRRFVDPRLHATGLQRYTAIFVVELIRSGIPYGSVIIYGTLIWLLFDQYDDRQLKLSQTELQCRPWLSPNSRYYNLPPKCLFPLLDAMTDSATWYVYIVQTSRQLLYTGIATDVERRFQQHRDVFDGCPNAKGAKYFRGHEPVAVVYRESCPNRSVASQREHTIKRMSRSQKLALIGMTQ